MAIHYSSGREQADSLLARIVARGGKAFALGADLAAPGAGTGLAIGVNGGMHLI